MRMGAPMKEEIGSAAEVRVSRAGGSARGAAFASEHWLVVGAGCVAGVVVEAHCRVPGGRCARPLAAAGHIR